MLSRAAALESMHNGDPVRVKCVSPGGVKTLMWRTIPFFQELMAKEDGEEKAFRARERASPHGRFALPEQAAIAVLYLASDESLFVNGTNLVFDHGDTAYLALYSSGGVPES